MKKIKATSYLTEEPQRRLSPWRVLLGIFILLSISVGSVFGFKWWSEVARAASRKPWFASYVDVTTTPLYAFEQLGSTSTKNVILSFVVSSQTDPCTPAWGSVYSLTDASSKLDLDRRIARLRQQGGNIAVSFGGLKNNELATKCTDTQKLKNAYESVINHYNLTTIDLDLENEGLTNSQAVVRRAQAIADLQKEHRAAGKSLAVWLTLPVAPQGMTEDATNAVAQFLAHKVDIAGINLMTMDYAGSMTPGQTMEQASEKALTETQRQLGVLYKRAGISLNSASLWKKIGATPMIGQNDVNDEVFSVSDAQKLNTFAHTHGVGRISMWSANRDVACGDNYVDVRVVSTSCSGVKQEQYDFAYALSNGIDGDLIQTAGLVTVEDADAKTITPDDPTKSPYQIWKEDGAYLEGTKVVWHHNVYQAKWWTQGDMPDNPVLQSWQTPWQLIGPVLPGEKPIKQLTLPLGTYAEWSGTEEYDAGQRVLFHGIPYQAKWWTQGNSPAAAASNADSSPWVPLTQSEVEKILKQ